MSHRLLILNPGSTSTKAAVYDGEHQTAMKSIVHTNQDLAPYPSLYDQLDYRVALVRGWLAQEGVDLSTLSAVVGRGGIIPNIVAGGYLVDDNLADCLRNYPVFDHASNLGGLIAPFMADKLRGIRNPRIVAVEPASCPSLTRGKYAYDFCDTGRVTPLARMYTLGCGFIPSANHAGGLRYHGMSPILSKLYHDGYMEAVAYEQTRVFEAAVLFAKRETILPAPESAHAIRGAIDEALRCRESREAKTILFGLTGTGYFDMTAYENYLNGKMSDSIPTDADLQKGFDSLPKIPQNEGI